MMTTIMFDFPLPDRNPPKARATGGQLGALRTEHAALVARYDSAASSITELGRMHVVARTPQARRHLDPGAALVALKELGT